MTDENQHPRCCTVGCDERADVEVWEDRADIAFSDVSTYACRQHLDEAFTTIQEEGCPWRWGVRALPSGESTR